MQVHHTFDEMNRSLLRIRMVEEAIALRYREQKMRCPVHLSIGQEAIAVGVASVLNRNDYVLSNHRAHAHYLAKGGNLKKMIAEMYGKEEGCSRGRGGSMHLVDLSVGFLGSTPIVGGSIPVGVGVAFATYLKNEKKITAIFFGEAATEEGVFAESLNFASLHQLPVLFICENNFYSVYTPLALRQPAAREITAIAQAHGILAFKGDGNVVEEVHKLAAKAVEAMRKGSGPVLLEFSTYRFREHCGPDLDPYLPVDDVAFWQKKDPLRHVCTDTREEIEKEIEEAFAYAEKALFPHPADEEQFYA